jgi:hypothetical protein
MSIYCLFDKLACSIELLSVRHQKIEDSFEAVIHGHYYQVLVLYLVPVYMATVHSMGPMRCCARVTTRQNQNRFRWESCYGTISRLWRDCCYCHPNFRSFGNDVVYRYFITEPPLRRRIVLLQGRQSASRRCRLVPRVGRQSSARWGSGTDIRSSHGRVVCFGCDGLF